MEECHKAAFASAHKAGGIYQEQLIAGIWKVF